MSQFTADYQFYDLCKGNEFDGAYLVQVHGNGWANILCFDNEGQNQCLGEMPVHDPEGKFPSGDVATQIKQYGLTLPVTIDATCDWDDRSCITKTKVDGKLVIKVN
jgi:hypothetical protein